METLTAALEFVLRPIVGWIILSNLVGQFMKTLVFTRQRAAAAGKLRWLWRWGRRTLPLHPAAAGCLLGLLWPGTIEGDYSGGTLTGVLYFTVGGALSVWAFEVVKGVVKKYQGIDLSPAVEEDRATVPPDTPRTRDGSIPPKPPKV